MYKRLENLLLEGALSGASRAYLKHARSLRTAINNNPDVNLAPKGKKGLFALQSIKGNPDIHKLLNVNRLIPRKRKRENDYVRKGLSGQRTYPRSTAAMHFKQRRKEPRPTKLKSKGGVIYFS